MANSTPRRHSTTDPDASKFEPIVVDPLAEGQLLLAMRRGVLPFIEEDLRLDRTNGEWLLNPPNGKAVRAKLKNGGIARVADEYVRDGQRFPERRQKVEFLLDTLSACAAIYKVPMPDVFRAKDTNASQGTLEPAIRFEFPAGIPEDIRAHLLRMVDESPPPESDGARALADALRTSLQPEKSAGRNDQPAACEEHSADAACLESPDQCANCGICEFHNNGMLRCGRCKAEYYCTKKCQKANWRKHKAVCIPVPPLEAMGSKDANPALSTTKQE